GVFEQQMIAHLHDNAMIAVLQRIGRIGGYGDGHGWVELRARHGAVDQKILIEIVELLEPQIVQHICDLISHGYKWLGEHGIEAALLEQASARGFARPQAGPTLRAVKEADEGPRGAADAGGCVERKVDIAHQSGLFGWQAA